MSNADIGLIGLAVMGQNLILNMAEHGYTVTAYNRTTSKARAARARAHVHAGARAPGPTRGARNTTPNSSARASTPNASTLPLSMA